MSDVNFESDQFLKLLTDALRAGPGSPAWHQALQKLSADGHGADEYRILCTAREHLESGRKYRAIRPGPEFTRKVMAAIENHAAGRGRRWPIANLIAGFSALLIITALLIVGYYLLTRSEPRQAGIDQLARTYFGTPVLSVDFTDGLPVNWQPIGRLGLDITGGLHSETVADKDYLGGGGYFALPVEANEPFSVEVALRVAKNTEDVVVQAFVTDNPEFSEDRATSDHELVWMLQGGRTRVVLPGGEVEGRNERIDPARDPVLVRLRIDRKLGIIDVVGQRPMQLWAGAHGLSDDRPRYVGVRFLRRSGIKEDPIAIDSISITRK